MATALWTETEALAERNIRHIVRDPTMLLDAILSPVLFLLIFLATFQELFADQGIDYIQYLVPVIVVQSMFFAAVTTSVALAADVQKGMHERLRTLPLHPSAVFTGRLSADIVRIVVSLTILLALAVVFGFRFEAGFVPAVGFVVVAVLAGIWLMSGYAALGLFSGDPRSAEGLGLLPFAILGLFNTGFVPREGFPGWLQPLVANQPVSKIADALRALSGGGPTLRPVLEALAWLIPMIILFVWLATVAYRHVGALRGDGGAAAPEDDAPVHVELGGVASHASAETMVEARREGGVIRTTADTVHLWARNIVLQLRSPEVLAYNALFPVALFLFSIASFSRVVFPGDSGSYVNYVLPLAAVQAIAFSSISTGISMFEDIDSGIINRYRTLPISRSAPLGGRLGADLTRALAQVILLVLVGLVIGFSFDNGFLGAVGFFLLPLVFALWPLALGITLGLVVRSVEGVPAAVFPWLFPLTMFSTGFVPVESFPGWLQPVVRANPFSAICDAMRAMVSGGDLAGPLWRTLAWSFGLALVFGLLARRAMHERQV